MCLLLNTCRSWYTLPLFFAQNETCSQLQVKNQYLEDREMWKQENEEGQKYIWKFTISTESMTCIQKSSQKYARVSSEWFKIFFFYQLYILVFMARPYVNSPVAVPTVCLKPDILLWLKLPADFMIDSTWVYCMYYCYNFNTQDTGPITYVNFHIWMCNRTKI